MKRNYPQCPYCGRRMTPPVAFLLKSEGEYRCTKCSGVSNIELESGVYKLAAGLVLAAAGVFVVSELLRWVTGWTVLLVLLPFLVFYFLAPFYVCLKRPVIQRKRQEHRAPNSITGGINDGMYGPPGRRLEPAGGPPIIQPDLDEQATQVMPSHIPLAVPLAVPADEPTIRMAPTQQLVPSLYDTALTPEEIPGLLRPVPPSALQPAELDDEVGRFGLQKSMQQFEEKLGQEAEPVFYQRPQRADPKTGYAAYRAPLHRKGRKRYE